MRYQITSLEVLQHDFVASEHYEGIKDMITGGGALSLEEACAAQAESELDYPFDEDSFDAIFDVKWASKEYAKMFLAEAESDADFIGDNGVQGTCDLIKYVGDGSKDDDEKNHGEDSHDIRYFNFNGQYFAIDYDSVNGSYIQGVGEYLSDIEVKK
jgi:hypothetical protein